jgi:serine-type D-Ala-D-Ala carboxypeptidase
LNTKIVNIIISEEIKMKKSIFKNIKVEEIIKSMESKFFTIFKRYDAGNLNISLSYINKPDIFYEKQIYGNNTEIIPASIIKLFTIDYFLHVLKDHNLLNSTTSTTVGEEINNKYVNKYLFKVGLKRGEKYRIIDLIDLAIIPSASDAVYVLSRFVYNVLFGISLNDSSFISNFDDWEWMLLRISQEINNYYSDLLGIRLNILDPTGIRREKIKINDLNKFLRYLIIRNSEILEITAKPQTIISNKKIFRTTNSFLRKDKPEFNPHVRGLKTGTLKGWKNLFLLYKLNSTEFITILVSGCDKHSDTKELSKLIISELENKLYNLSL